MNDGMSQDRWEKVLEASQLLRATDAELFGVALGDNIDLRELEHYIGSTDRIYRDNSTERLQLLLLIALPKIFFSLFHFIMMKLISDS